MKNTHRLCLIMLIAVLPVLTMGCDPDPEEQNPQQETELTRAFYRIDNVEKDTLIAGENGWMGLINMLLVNADNGHTVAFGTTRQAYNYVLTATSPEVVNFSTDDRNEARNWSYKMMNRGYTVTIRKDRSTNIYHCSATR